MTRPTALIAFLLSLLILGGCESEEETRPPATDLMVANAAPGYGTLSVRRGSTQAAQIGTLSYGQRNFASFDSGTYNFTIDSIDPVTGTSSVEEATFTAELEAGQDHMYVLTDQNSTIVPLRFSRPKFSDTSTEWELNIVHATESVAGIDYYVLPSGTDITTVGPSGSLAFTEADFGITLQPGSYEITLTEANNAGNVLFAGIAFDFAAGNSVALIVAPSIFGTADALSLLGTIGTTSFDLPDTSAPTSVRFANGAADGLPRDVFLDGDFTTPFVDDVAFGTATDYIEVPPGTSEIAITPGDNPSVVESTLTNALLLGAPHTILISGTAGAITANAVPEVRVRTPVSAQLVLLNVNNTYEELVLFVVEPGTDFSDISTVEATLILPTPAASVPSPYAPGTWELVAADISTANIVLGPISLALAGGGLYAVLLYDSGDGTNISATLLDDF